MCVGVYVYCLDLSCLQSNETNEGCACVDMYVYYCDAACVDMYVYYCDAACLLSKKF